MNENNEFLRLFVAVDMPESVVHEVARIQKVLEEQALFEGRFTTPEQVHITLKFIGRVLQDQMQPITTALQGIAYKKIPAQLGGVDVFAIGNRIKITYLSIICPELKGLAKEVEAVLEPWAEPEKRDFVSHATIARVKRVEDKQQLLGALRKFEVQPLSFTFDAFVLKQSVLSDQGPTYTNLATYPLQ